MIFLFPTEFEAKLFRELHPHARVVICGVGMAETSATLSRIIIGGDVDEVILVGIAGAYDIGKNPVNQVVEVVSETIEELPLQFSKIYTIAPRWGLPKVSSNTVNRSHFRGAKSDIENMEGAVAAAICSNFGVKFSEIRSISNLVGDPFEKWSVESAIKALTLQISIIYNR